MTDYEKGYQDGKEQGTRQTLEMILKHYKENPNANIGAFVEGMYEAEKKYWKAKGE